MGHTAAIIPARAGSKGLARKNLVTLCGRPLIAWSVLQANAAASIDSVWVSSDGDEILEVASEHGARTISRPAELASDEASSESAWEHALGVVEGVVGPVTRVVAMQATSPLREAADLDDAVAAFDRNGLDSLLSVVPISDFFVWRLLEDGLAEPVNYDYRSRSRRQAIQTQYRENGSFYIFTPALLQGTHSRLGGRIGVHVMAEYKMFQIDSSDDVRLCEVLMESYGLSDL